MPDAAPPPRFAYMPFGAGLRICVGGRLASTELVLVVANLVRTFRIDLPPHSAVAPV